MNDKLARTIHPVESTEGDTDEVEVGQWYWVAPFDDDKKPWLACVTEIGSNYAEVTSVGGRYERIHFDEFDECIDRREMNPDEVIAEKVGRHKANVKKLMGEIRALTARLGLTPAGEIPESTEQSNALVVAHGKKNINAHKKALIKAKEKTLPDLFEKVEKQHEQMAIWMKAKLIPMKAEAKILRHATEGIENQIFIVELYAGLCEELVQIRKGEPASNDYKIRLFQRRHYMDEECLLQYKAGGMDFTNIEDFDRWLMKKANRERILSFPKCVVAFQVRRKRKEREANTLGDFIRFSEMAKEDESTFLYIRNGDRYYRLETGIDFGEKLFPDQERSEMMKGQIYWQDWPSGIVSEREYLDHKAEQDERRAEYEEKHAAWKKLSKAEREDNPEPWYHERHEEFTPLTPDTVNYDDGMRELAEITQANNRVAIVMQGLLDRSPAFHPHPPWQLWTPEGFNSAIQLLFDDSRALSPGEAPDFEAYRDALNESIVKGTRTVGQEIAWLVVEANKENDRQRADWRIKHPLIYQRFAPYGNPGPGEVAIVTAVTRNKSKCSFRWDRERLRETWRHDRGGNIPVNFKCSKTKLLNLDAYKPGDYKQFYEDPRTRADYLKWAPLLLVAEDFYGKKQRKTGRKNRLGSEWE